MEYKEIYDELYTVLWGDEIAKNKEVEGLTGVEDGFLLKIHDPFHNGPRKYDPKLFRRIQRIFKKYADKIYLETKDEYAINLMRLIGEFTFQVSNDADLEQLYQETKGPDFAVEMFNKDDVTEPTLEPRCCLVVKYININGEHPEEQRKYFRFFEEAKDEFDKLVSQERKYGFNDPVLELANDDVAIYQSEYKLIEIVKCD